MKASLLLAATAALLAACATDPAPQARDEKVYATGSNIARRDRAQTMTPEAFEQLRNQSIGNTGRPRGD